MEIEVFRNVQCSQLTELNIHKGVGTSTVFDNNILIGRHVCALVNYLTPNILKLSLGSQEFVEDEHVNTLVHRCNKITELDLSCTSITNDSIEVIVKQLNSLEKLSLDFTKIDVSTILQLKSIPTLKILRCFYGNKNTEKIKNLKLQLPHIRINEEHLHIACSTKEVNGSIDPVPCWFWEIRAEEQDLFPKAQ